MILNEALTWDEIRYLVDTYQLERLGRSHAQNQAYAEFKKKMKAKHIDMATNLLVNTLHWLPENTETSLSPDEAMEMVKYKDARPFADPDDVFITLNNFPYYIRERTIHLLAWVKFPMPPDPNSEIGDISDDMKQIIETYVCKTFVDHLQIPRDCIIWWKNYTAIQSIKSLPHVHILINLENDKEGLLEKKIESVIGTSGVMLPYNRSETQNCKL